MLIFFLVIDLGSMKTTQGFELEEKIKNPKMMMVIKNHILLICFFFDFSFNQAEVSPSVLLLSKNLSPMGM